MNYTHIEIKNFEVIYFARQGSKRSKAPNGYPARKKN
jgi:hypothetical protein